MIKDYQIFRARVGAVVKRRRKQRGLTQTELAALIGIEQPNVARIEKGKQGFDSDTLFNMSRALECSLGDFFSEVEQVAPENLSAEARAFAKSWMKLPPEMREDYRKRITALAVALEHPVPDERNVRSPASKSK